jgi:single-strand DNA-binding protein
MSFAKVIILGNLGNIPEGGIELHHTPDGTAYCSFSVAADFRQGRETKTAWFRCTVWGKTSETLVKYAEKGKQIYVEGFYGESEWTDRENRDRLTKEVNVKFWEFTGSGLTQLFRESEELESREMERERGGAAVKG